MAVAQFNLSDLIAEGNIKWAQILQDVLRAETGDNTITVLDEEGNFIWPEAYAQNDFIPLKITAKMPVEDTDTEISSNTITIYLHKCAFEKVEHHILHPNSTVEEYTQASIDAITESKEDTKIHFVPDWRKEEE